MRKKKMISKLPVVEDEDVIMGDDEDEDEDEDEDDDVMDIPMMLLPTLVHNFRSRYDLKIIVPPADNQVAAMAEVLQAFLTQLQSVDPKLIIYPWKMEGLGNKNKCLKNAKEMPKTLSGIQEYFHNCWPIKKGGTQYIQVFLGHAHPFDMLHLDIKWWLDNMQYGMYLKQLQVETTQTTGWLLYLTCDMELDKLRATIWKEHQIKVSMHWHIILIGQRITLPEDQQIWAIYIELNGDCHGEHLSKIQEIYSFKQTSSFPLGIKMWFIPNLRGLNEHSHAKYFHARAHQGNFCARVKSMMTWEITSLDHARGDAESLCMQIMAIKVTDEPEKPLFHAITKHWLGDGHILQFLPQYEVEAREWVTNLLPFLQHGKDMVAVKELNKYFTAAAVACSKLCKWDEEAGMVMSMQDHMLEGCDDEADPEYDITSAQVKILGMEELLAVASNPQAAAAGLMAVEKQVALDAIIIEDGTNDSISTFHPHAKMQQKMARVLKKKPLPAATATAGQPPMDDMMTEASSLTMATLATKIGMLEHMMMQLINHLDPEMPQTSPVWKKTKQKFTDSQSKGAGAG